MSRIFVATGFLLGLLLILVLANRSHDHEPPVAAPPTPAPEEPETSVEPPPPISEEGPPTAPLPVVGYARLTAGSEKLTVRVLAADGAPMAGVEAGLSAGIYRVWGVTDAKGCLRFEGLPATGMRLEVRPPVDWEADPHVEGPLLPRGGERVVTLRRLVAVSGVVLKEDGEPWPWTTVRAATESGWESETRAGREGRFEILCPDAVPVRVDLHWRFQENAESLIAHAEIPDVAPPAANLVLRARRIEGRDDLVVRVLDPKRNPLADARVDVSGHGVEVDGRTGADGRLVAANLPRLDFEVLVHPPALEQSLAAPPPVRAVPGSGEVVIETVAAETVPVLLRLPDGRPAAGASVRVWPARSKGGMVEFLTAGDDARFELRFTEVGGEYGVEAKCTIGESTWVAHVSRLRAEGGPLTITLVPAE